MTAVEIAARTATPAQCDSQDGLLLSSSNSSDSQAGLAQGMLSVHRSAALREQKRLTHESMRKISAHARANRTGMCEHSRGVDASRDDASLSRGDVVVGLSGANQE